MKILIENSTQPNDIVLDPFVGIGAVARACLETDRRFICCEPDTTYCDITNKYIQDIDKNIVEASKVEAVTKVPFYKRWFLLKSIYEGFKRWFIK